MLEVGREEHNMVQLQVSYKVCIYGRYTNDLCAGIAIDNATIKCGAVMG